MKNANGLCFFALVIGSCLIGSVFGWRVGLGVGLLVWVLYQPQS